MARVTYVKTARKDQGKCGRCGDDITKGRSYFHASPGFRSRKLIRCVRPECRFRQSELTTSKMSEVYAAQEDAEYSITLADCLEDVMSALNDCAERVREVSYEYREAAEAMGAAGEENETRADELESYADNLDSFDISQYEADPDDLDVDEDSCLEEAKEAAREELDTL